MTGHRGASGYRPAGQPTSFRSIGLPLEEPLVRPLRRNGLNRRNAPVFVQSSGQATSARWTQCLRVPLVRLLRAPS